MIPPGIFSNAISVSIVAGPLSVPSNDFNHHSSSPPGQKSYMLYTIAVENHVEHQTHVITRRFRDFYHLRKKLLEEWEHYCPGCAAMKDQIASYPFPRRRIFRSHQDQVVQERVEHLEMFLRFLLQCIFSRALHGCDHAQEKLQHVVMTTFLELPAMIDVDTEAEEGERRIVSRVESESSTCSECLRDWHACYCGM